MKKGLFTLMMILCCALAAYAQPTAGLLAHWDMDSTANDVSGNGHNGHMNNLAPAMGMDGVMGHAWYFNGTTSSITIPSTPALNVTAYTITANVKVNGFYLGYCHENIIFARGSTDVVNGIYYLGFNDFPYGNPPCTGSADTVHESFVSVACSATASLGGAWTAYNYTPYIAENLWYTVVATFNDTTFNLFVDGVLKSSVASPTPGVPIGTSTDSASIFLQSRKSFSLLMSILLVF